MSYSTKLDAACSSLLTECKNRIIDRWGNWFDMWLDMDGFAEFGHLYQSCFKDQFGEYITPEIEGILFFAGTNIKFAIKAYKKYNRNATRDQVVRFTELFITEQLDDCCNWMDLSYPDDDDTDNENPE